MFSQTPVEIMKLDENDKDLPTQADGQSSLQIIGKASFTATRGKVNFSWIGYVSRTLHANILCGGSFMERNNIIQELNNKRIIIDRKYFIMETSPFCPTPYQTQTFLIRRFFKPFGTINQ